MIDHKIAKAAKRLVANTDFQAMMAHLLDEQGIVVLSMDANSPMLASAKIYYDALRDVTELVKQAAEVSDE